VPLIKENFEVENEVAGLEHSSYGESANLLKLNDNEKVNEELKEISAEELKALLANSTTLQLIDVRESWEHEIENIGGQLISLSDLIKSIPLLTVTAPVILYCEKGERSRIAQQRLAAKGFLNTINLKGGLKAWRGSIKK